MMILYYDDTRPKKELYDLVKQIRGIIDDKVLVLPKNFDVLLNCSLDQLVSVKALIDTAIAEKIKEMPVDTSIKETSKYLN